ncbi:hypothetical protein [Nonomuraea sp. NPDC049607]|uniref:hypothetical protein n=1 Tax=unclassified Nonomuraea TaxID=2593643 RepID=UPI00342BE0BA
MSRLYWHTPTRTAELLGAEYAWLHNLAGQPAEAAWALDRAGSLDRVQLILGWARAADGDGTTDLRKLLTEAKTHPHDAALRHRLVQTLQVRMRLSGLDLDVAGVRLNTGNVDLNTALAVGSDPMRLAAKIAAWGSQHAFIEGPDRAWAADIVDQGLAAGPFRKQLTSQAVPHGPKRTVELGWGDVLALLRERDDEPVVLSYSAGESFPNATIAGWEPPLDEDDEPVWDGWYELPAAEKWTRAMAGLRERRWWARLAPDTLAEVTFSLPVTVYDLLADDREDRVHRAATA